MFGVMEIEEQSIDLTGRGPTGFWTRWGVGILILVAVVATLPGWLPRRVYVSSKAVDRDSPQSQIISQVAVAGGELRKGRWPLWNPSAGLGEPLLERGMVGVFAPTILPHLLLKPTWTWTISTALRAAMAGIGFWFLAGRYGLRDRSRFMVAAIFMLGAMNLAHFNESLLNLLPWLPWGVLACEWIIVRVSLWRIVLVSLVFAGQFLTGDPAASICLLATVAAVMFFNLAWFKPRRALVALPAVGLAIVLGIGLSAVQWIPMWMHLTHGYWKMPVGLSSRANILWMWGLPTWMAMSLLSGAVTTRLNGRRANADLPPNESPALSGNSFKTAWLCWVALIALIGLSIGQQRGVSLTEFNAAQQDLNQHSTSKDVPGPSEMTLAWGVPKSDWYRTRSEVEVNLSKPTFDSKAVVLLNDEISPDAMEWLDRIIPDRHKAGAEGKSFWSSTPKVESADQSGNQIRVRVKSGGTGWIVLRSAFAEGWTAHTRPTGPLEAWAIRREQIVLPANGKLMAVPVAVSMPVEIVLHYWPASFRRGLLVSCGTGVVVVLLLGLGLSCKI